MTKYLGKSFSSPANNQNYRDNYDRIFRKALANGYCNDISACTATLIMTIIESGDEEVWPVTMDHWPEGLQKGSICTFYSDGTLDICRDVWTKEEIEEIEEKSKAFDPFFDMTEHGFE